MFFKKLTKNDYEILRVMVEKGTTNSKEISRELNISDKTIRNRMAIMKEADVFKPVVVVNPKAFGYALRVDFFLKVKKVNITKVIDWLMDNFKHSIIYLGRHWGEDNMSVQFVFKDGEEAEKFQNTLKENKMVTEYEISIVPLIVKETFNWRPHQSNFNITPKGMKELRERRKKAREESEEKKTAK